MEQVEAVTTVAKGIGDLGMMAIVAAFFLVLSAALMVACFKWFKSVVDSMILDYANSLKDLNKSIAENNRLLTNMVEGLKPITKERIEVVAELSFNNAIEAVCRTIKRIRKENNIRDKQATADKIRRLLKNVHECRNNQFDAFTYHGRKLSFYTNDDWVEKVAQVIEGEIYHENGANNERAFTNVKAIYNSIRLDFYHNLDND